MSVCVCVRVRVCVFVRDSSQLNGASSFVFHGIPPVSSPVPSSKIHTTKSPT